MQAIVLVGGMGTRLRPLTDNIPKPALTLVDRPFLAYMIEWLGEHGVTEAVPGEINAGAYVLERSVQIGRAHV